VLYQECLLIYITEVWFIYLFICSTLNEAVNKLHCISFNINKNIFEYWRKKFSSTLRIEDYLRAFQNRVRRKVFGSRRRK